MRASSILTLGTAALAAAAPAQLEERQAELGQFHVSNFVYGCTTTCDWSFDVTVGPKFANHPPVKKTVHCEGSTDIKSFQDGTCSDISDTKTIRAFIGPQNRLRLQYEVSFPEEGSRYAYTGGKKVNAQTSGKPQPSEFVVPETKATGVA